MELHKVLSLWYHPQRELDIRARKKIIISEHCGRILVDEELANEESEKMTAIFK